MPLSHTVTIVTAVRNGAGTIARCLTSVARQSVPVEHIIIDGQSTDGTLELLRGWKESRLTIVSEPDRGIYDAMRKGLARAKGEVIGFLNADDFYASPKVLEWVASAFADPTVASCYGDLVYVRSDDSLRLGSPRSPSADLQVNSQSSLGSPRRPLRGSEENSMPNPPSLRPARATSEMVHDHPTAAAPAAPLDVEHSTLDVGRSAPSSVLRRPSSDPPLDVRSSSAEQPLAPAQFAPPLDVGRSTLDVRRSAPAPTSVLQPSLSRDSYGSASRPPSSDLRRPTSGAAPCPSPFALCPKPELLCHDDEFSIPNERVTRRWKAGAMSERSFYYGWMPPHPTFFVRRGVYDKLGGFRLDLGTSADYELMLRFLVRHQITTHYVPRVLVKMGVGGVSNVSLKNRWDAHQYDHLAWAVNDLRPYPWTLPLKPLRKIFQWL